MKLKSLNFFFNLSIWSGIGFIFLFILGLNIAKSETQWAYNLIGFSSEFSYKICSAKEILGKPSIINNYVESPCAWAPQNERSNNEEWIHVGFENPQFCQQVVINETFNPGAISKVYLVLEDNTEEMVFENKQFPYVDDIGRMFYIFFDKTDLKVKSLKLFLQTSRIPGFNYIDAIGISDEKDTIKVEINYPKSNLNLKPVNLGTNVNSFYPELAPIISYDGQKLFFTRNLHPDNYGEEKKYDIWISEFDSVNKSFNTAKNIGRPLNNEKANFVISAMPGNNELILGNVYLPDGGMKQGLSNSFTDGKIWSMPEEIKINGFVNTSKKGVNYCISSSGKKMILSIDNDSSKGKNDLFISFISKDGSWSQPKNLGKIINTAASEETPFLASDEKTLYFSTSGYPGFGSNDIFVSRRLDDSWTNWSEPINLGPAINTSGWDGYYTIPAAGDYAYFVSTINSLGNEDIFKIELEEALKPTPVVLISGRVYSSKDSVSLSSKISYEDLVTGEEVGVVRSNPLTGEYKIILPAGKNYGFAANTKGFIAINENLDLTKIDSYTEIQTDLTMVPIEVGQKVRLNNIFFEFAKFDLLPQSYLELNRVIELLKSNPNMQIEIQGHTDNIGKNERNLLMSKNRAEAVYNYIVSQGIDKSRLVAKGYGKEIPILPNTNDANRSKNRRVEFLILKNDK